MAHQICVDLYQCNEKIIDDMEQVTRIAHDIIEQIGAGIVKECYHKFEPIGITYIAVITTSHFSIHTWPEYRYVAVDVFSCAEEIPDIIVEKLKDAFDAKRFVLKDFQREICESSIVNIPNIG